MTTYNRQWLRDQVASYLKDRTLSAEIETFIDLAAARVSQIMECREMEVVQTNRLIVSADAPLDGGGSGGGSTLIVDGGDAFAGDEEAKPTPYVQLTNKVRRLVQVQVLERGEWRSLKSLPTHSVFPLKRPGVPVNYYIEENRVYPVPLTEGTFRVIYLSQIEIPIGDAAPKCMSAYPFVFLNAALAEAYDWKQDAELYAAYEQKWLAEATRIREIYRGEMIGEVPAVRAV